MMWKHFSNNQSKTKQTLPTKKRGMNTTASLQSAVLELRSNPRGINRFSLDKQFSNFCAVNLLCHKGSILHVVQEVCTGLYPNCIVVHIINNNEYRCAFIRFACMPGPHFSCMFVCACVSVCVCVYVVPHVIQKLYLIRCYFETFKYLIQGFPQLCHLWDLRVHINGKCVPGAVTFTATIS